MFRKAIRFGALMLVFSLIFGSLSACVRPASSDDEDQWSLPTETTTLTEYPVIIDNPYGKITVWSYSDDIKIMAHAFMGYNPCIEVDYVEFSSMDEFYQQSVLAAAGTVDCPDVIVMDSAFVKEFVDSNILYDLSDLKPHADVYRSYANTIEVGTNFETGEVCAYSYQNTPGAVFFRRSLAREYFGTDDPSEIQKLMSDWDKFTEMAETVKTKSEGKSFMLSSVVEFCPPFFNNRRSPWIVGNKLTIDPMIEDLTELAFTFDGNDYTANVTPWEAGWFEGMTDDLKDENGDNIQVFSYFLTSEEFLSVYKYAGHSVTDGDWACVPGPMAYSSGGTWLGVMKNASQYVFGTEFVRFCTLDEMNLIGWATGVYTQEYLADLNSEFSMPSGSETLFQSAGDFVSSQKVVESIIPFFDDSEMSDFLGGQNFYEAFAAVALNCPVDVIQGDDERIHELFAEALHSYVYEGMSQDDMFLTFQKSVQKEFPNIMVE
ncbi:MAG: extracellular solute-binding protein [Clostridiales bacterium]|nr:extracellular solute-binding protein [Clostridiales bacterium]